MLAGKPPSERIQFLLGMDDDEDHQTHDIFCEMGELRHEADEYEWKETARCVRVCLPLRLRLCMRKHRNITCLRHSVEATGTCTCRAAQI